MLPPNNGSIRELSREEGISEATLCLWRQKAREEGRLLPDAEHGQSDKWSSSDKFAAVLESAALNESQLAEYCRKRGVYPEQIKAWRKACEQANDWQRDKAREVNSTLKSEREQRRELERELRRKDKALAEAVALLILKKNPSALGRGRGRMSALNQRLAIVGLLHEAVTVGARRAKACAVLGLSLRTLQRWWRGGVVHSDARPDALRPVPANKLSDVERRAALALCHRPEYASLPPTQIVPREADQGRYVACESTLYRILREHGQLNHRGRAKAPRRQGEPRTHCATAPNQVWCWDITWLAGPVRGLFYYLYMVIDLYSRKIVGWEVYEREGADHASGLTRRAVLSEQCLAMPQVLHSDNGSVQKASTLMATLDALGVEPSYSRPRVSNDNAFAESLFRTCKYRPDYPLDGFATIDAAREWVARFVHGYHEEHRHRSLRYITPAQRHDGLDTDILTKRHALYQQAKAKHPERWSGSTRCWEPIAEVWLNPRASETPSIHRRSTAA